MGSRVARSTDRKILNEMLSLPTAPFAEHFVVDYVERFCRSRRTVSLKRDAAGNLLVHFKQGRRRIARPVCITAHLDHPGFVADRMIGKRRLRAYWRGRVAKEYFVGTPVRFFVEGRGVRGQVRSVKTVVHNERRRVDTAIVDVREEVPSGAIGMWDLPAVEVRGKRIHATACDDLVGASAMLCCIAELGRRRLSGEAYFLFTRAEEIGFAGAIAAARRRTIPQKCFVLAMETSSELPHAQMGAGPILRVGDRISTFTSKVTEHCQRVADSVAREDRRFKYQRRLMDGGACESSAYCALGYEATGLCVALGNYHNMEVKRERITREYVDLDDFDNAVKWFVALARSSITYTGRDQALHKQLSGIERKYQKLLRTSVVSPR
ncbi:MAG: M20/M25/M40 family metallo-hydrolase [Planctomycetes bacterium]|nr:M20/M25/M40 family metallo-hydrolase [Planctomycetota bacterium]